MILETSAAVARMLAWSAVSRTLGRLSRWVDECTRAAALRAQAHLNRDAFVRELRRDGVN